MRELRTFSVAGMFVLGMTTGLGCVGDALEDPPLIGFDVEEELDLQFSIGSGDRYVAIEDDSICQVIYSSQGGYFVMANVEADVPDQSLLSCGLLVGDELISEHVVRMRQVGDQVLGGLILPVFPGYPERAGELHGLPGTLYCQLESARAEVYVTIEVILLESDSDAGWEQEEYSSATVAQQ